ncbi:MAG: hypothetical protein LBN71_05460 [Tannerella sp.]|nr:hypothetical protein [Tannerella sp.]
MSDVKELSGNKVIIENGEIRTVFSEETINNGGWLTIEECGKLWIEGLNKVEELLNQNGSNSKRQGLL